MAEELYDCAVAVKALLDEIPTVVEKTHLGPPSSIVARCEVAVIVKRLRHAQAGSSAHGQRHYLLLRGYAPMGSEPEEAEKKLYKLWNLMIDKLNANVTLSGTASRSNLEDGYMGYKLVGSAKCRTLEAKLEVYLVQAEAYAA